MEYFLKNFSHVCFDKDGTLIDVHATWVPITQRRAQRIIKYYELSQECFSDLCLAMGVDVQSQKILPGGPVGYKPRVDIIQSSLNWLRQKEIQSGEGELAEIFREIDVEFQNNPHFVPKVLDGVVAGIKQLKSSGLKISIYTSDRNKTTQKTIDYLGLQDAIDVVIGGDDVKNPKPDPEGFLRACEQINVDVKHSIYVGDTLDDMRMARMSGCAGCVGVSHGLSTRAELESQCDVVFESFLQLTKSFLKENGKKTTSQF